MVENDSEQVKKEYEMSFLLTGDEAAQGVLRVLGNTGAEVFWEGPREQITLAYPVKKAAAARFGFVHFRALPEAIAAVRRALRHEQDVLRILIVTPPFSKMKSRWEVPAKQRNVPAAGEATPRVPKPEPASALPLSNEALEKKIEEILQ